MSRERMDVGKLVETSNLFEQRQLCGIEHGGSFGLLEQQQDEALGPATIEKMEQSLEYIIEEAKKAQSSLAKLKSNPQRFAPQRSNVIHHLQGIMQASRSIVMREK